MVSSSALSGAHPLARSTVQAERTLLVSVPSYSRTSIGLHQKEQGLASLLVTMLREL